MIINRRTSGMLLALLCSLGLGACTGFGGFGVINKGLNCIGDSSVCISKREAALNAMLADGTRSWVYEVPSGSAYLSGVRSLAYKKLIPSLTCQELQHGMLEMTAAPTVLARDDPSGGDPALLSRAKILSASVNRDLTRRYRQNCKSKKSRAKR